MSNSYVGSQYLSDYGQRSVFFRAAAKSSYLSPTRPAVRVISDNPLYPAYERTADEIRTPAASAGSPGRYEDEDRHHPPRFDRAAVLETKKRPRDFSPGALLR
jgi:hypothetical protein